MNATLVRKPERQYYIDWLRIILILSVFLFHIGMIFNSWDWHIKNDVRYSGALKNIMLFLHYWRMPLLFLISGAGTYFALGKRTTGQYLGERYKRLMIPLGIGIFTLVPVQVYIEKTGNYDSLWSYYTHMFEGVYPEGNFSWHHLWFIAYLFFISLIISPLLGFFRSHGFKKFSQNVEQFASKPLSLNIMLMPLVLSQALLRPYFPDDTHALFNDWAAMSYYILFFLAGFVLLSNKTIANHIAHQRYLYLIEAIIATAFMFSSPSLFSKGVTIEYAWKINSIVVAWSCGMAAVGFSKRYLNFNSKLRKLANEAIYPFYLLHQPVIVVLGNFVVQWQIPVIWKVLAVTVSSFTLSVALYWYLIRPFNIMRVIFGMKKIPKERKQISQVQTISVPVRANKNYRIR